MQPRRTDVHDGARNAGFTRKPASGEIAGHLRHMKSFADSCLPLEGHPFSGLSGGRRLLNSVARGASHKATE